jgi:plastocyanin
MALRPASLAHAEVRDFYIVTVHHDGKTSLKGDATHKAEAFPQQPLVSTAGMSVKKPAENGDWSVRAFVFDPAEVTVQQGDEVRLHFVGVHGGSHTIVVEGVAKPVTVTRGTEQVVSFKAERRESSNSLARTTRLQCAARLLSCPNPDRALARWQLRRLQCRKPITTSRSVFECRSPAGWLGTR